MFYYQILKLIGYRDIHPSECPQCGGDEFILDPLHTEKRQVTELPEIQPYVTQFNIHTNLCVCCGHKVKAEIPKEAESAFGPRLKGFIALLSGDLGLTKRKVESLADYLEKVYEQAMALELKYRGLAYAAQVPVAVYYKGEKIRGQVLDMVVENYF